VRLPASAHTSQTWRIHEFTRDFVVEDVWALATPGGRGDFPRLVTLMASHDPTQGSRIAAILFAIRNKIGELAGWDVPSAGLGGRSPSLRDRLPAQLRETPGPDFRARNLTPVYLLDDEYAGELANRTVHAVFHFGWVADGTGGYRGQMAILVKPNGLLGTGYMAAIRPFRRQILYPAAVRRFEQRWRASLRPQLPGK